jgi:ribonuclease BN (tRNA processing enzyme)
MQDEFEFHEYDGQPIRLGPFTITTSRVVHPVPGYGMRVERAGKVLAYSGDTGPCDALVELARGADLLLVEASFREGDDNPPGLHLTGREAGEAARKAGVGTLVLTHIPPWHDKSGAVDEAREVFDGRTELAATGSTYDV